jgi:outer membrane receptor for ferrienterochelin and colicins
VTSLRAAKHMGIMLLCSCLAQPALAQEAAAPTPQASSNSLEPRIENGKQVYEAGQFTRFAPQTALDMAFQIPGFSISEVSNERGLGEASQNVLINGQRITGKSNDAQTALSRIPLSSVIRLEVADAAAFNVPGINGQVLNVVAKEGGLKGNFSYRIETREVTGTNPRQAEINLSGKLGKGNFTLGINNNGSFKGGADGEEFNRFADSDSNYIRLISARNRGDRPRIAGSYSLTANNGNIFNANGALEYFRFRRRNEIDRFADGVTVTTAVPETFQLARGGEDEFNYELGGDYEFGLGKGRLKLIAFRRFENSDTSNEFRSDPSDGDTPSGQRFDRLVDEGETVIRSEYRWKAGKSDWQISLEGALNYLDAESEFFELEDGVYQPQSLDGATARVEEKRAQSIITYGRPLSGKISLQTTLGAEYSQLSQTGANGLTRSFIRPKGSVALTWKASSALTVSSKFQRRVGQLSFFDFLASKDVQNDNDNSSNAQLVPSQSWLWENEANLSLGKAGSIKFKLDGELISDLVDQVEINGLEAIGNLPGKAKRLRGEINGSFVLDAIGFSGAKLDTVLALQATSVRDALLINRPLSNRGRSYWSVNLRHDIPNTQWAWELFAEDSKDNGFYRLDYFGRDSRTGPFTIASIEHKNVMGMKARLSVFNLIGQRERSDELFYQDTRDGSLDFSRQAEFRYGKFVRLSISGIF